MPTWGTGDCSAMRHPNRRGAEAGERKRGVLGTSNEEGSQCLVRATRAAVHSCCALHLHQTSWGFLS